MPRVSEIDEDGGDPTLKAVFDKEREIFGDLLNPTKVRAHCPPILRAAKMLGANSFAVFRHVTLPLSMPGITSGCLMVFLLALGFFVTPALIGGPQQMMLATLVQQQVTELLNWPFAGAIIGVLLFAVLVLVIAFNRVVRLDRFVGQV